LIDAVKKRKKQQAAVQNSRAVPAACILNGTEGGIYFVTAGRNWFGYDNIDSGFFRRSDCLKEKIGDIIRLEEGLLPMRIRNLSRSGCGNRIPPLLHQIYSSDKLPRSDALRYFISINFGGVYLDMDVHCLRPMDSLVSRKPASSIMERPEQSRILHGVDFAVMNSAIGTKTSFAATGRRSMLNKTAKAIPTQLPDQPAWRIRVLQPHVFSPLPDRSAAFRDISSRLTKHQLTAQTAPSTSAQLKLDACQQLVEANSSAWIRTEPWRFHRFLHLGYAGHSARHRHRFPVDSLFSLVTTATKTES
uniref:Glycosyltransferase family 32 protein n=1 Tax=Macrostomum lignano TaxID=282301 RepID=A0A1I8FK93_9PLAT